MVVVELNHGSPVRMKLDSVSRTWVGIPRRRVAVLNAAVGGNRGCRGLEVRAAAQQPRPQKKAAAVVKNDYVPIDFSKSVEKVPFGEEEEEKKGPNIGAVWGLLILSVAYLHHSTTGFALPALLPIISSDLHLQDSQGALLTAGYTILYAVALVPMGLLADRVDRPRLLSFGIMAWSVLTLLASKASGFGELLAARIGFAAAQATQNPICFSLIPEMFPKGRTTAMAVYNSAIYVGRAFSFAALVIAGKLGVPQGIMENLDIAYTLVPLDKVDLSLVTIMYTQGDYAAVSPIFTYAQDVGDAGVALESAFGAWRQLLSWLGPPGIVIAVLCLLTIDETRPRNKGFLGDPIKSSRFLSRTTSSEALVAPAPEHMSTTQSLAESMDKLKVLIRDPAFLSLTIASTFNDVGSWALVAWQATFYQRVYELSPETYAPLLAVVIPVGGLIGGVGAGILGDWLNRIGGRGWITAGANIAAAPFIALSILAPDYKQSFAALLIGFALSEAWRAPAAVAVREVSPPGLGSTGSAVHLSIRNVIGGLGPLAVALIASKTDLQNAMLLVPACYLASGFGFLLTEIVIATQDKKV
mmetsp:Transcript_6815/g.13545  ORF Transcript_6815/g.13545 Transcript_6815/m.13545 type:complete len:584 (-) Transcript_6815:111-1862(-)